MSFLYPLGSEYEPGQTTEVRSTIVRESYRVTTVDGYTTVTPRDSSGGSQGSEVPPPGKPGGGGGGRSSCGGSPQLEIPADAPKPPASAAGPPSFPVPVGGVFLAGAGEALRTLGLIRGIAFDPVSGQIILISDVGPLTLPALSLDDVVTVFQTVYRHGAPYVSIDPDPTNPTGPWMKVRHYPGTEATHAGWVLFESDRLMKSYSLGRDNITRDLVSSKALGYRNLFQLGFEQPGWGTANGSWERFWIVPGKVHREKTRDGRMTLLSMTLRVRTEPMTLRGGKLEPSPNAKPSWAADQFSSWFTGSYGDVAKEAVTASPTGSRESSLAELERIALIAGAAEVLRDNGVPLPAWMLNHPVPRLAVPLETPSLLDAHPHPTRNVRVQIYGGVNLSPDDRDIVTEPASAGQEELARKIVSAIQAQPPVTPITIAHGGTEYRAVGLPGSDTMAEGALVLEAEDLSVSVAPGHQISMIRRTNSFVRPTDAFGPAWSLDLPRLDRQRRPLDRRGDTVLYREVWQLTSPLNSYSGYLTSGILRAHDGRIGQDTMLVPAASPRQQWHFYGNGCLAAISEPPILVVYRDNDQCHVDRIEGWIGSERSAYIDLHYGNGGHIISATSSDGGRASYEYDAAGALRRVQSPLGSPSYEYHDGLLTALTDARGTERFSFNSRGQQRGFWTVPSEPEAGDVSTKGLVSTLTLPEGGVWEIARNGEGRVVSILKDGREALRQTWRADGSLQAAHYETFSLYPQYRSDGAVSGLLITEPDNPRPGPARFIPRHTIIRNVSFPAGPFLPVAGGSVFARWLSVDLDQDHKPNRVRDFSGYDMRFEYDASGDLQHIATQLGEIFLRRDAQSRLTGVETSWGITQRNEYAGNELRRVTLNRSAESAAVDYERGNPVAVRALNGAHLQFSYDGFQGPGGRMEVVNPDGVALRYAFDTGGWVDTVQVGGLFSVHYQISGHCAGGCSAGP